MPIRIILASSAAVLALATSVPALAQNASPAPAPASAAANAPADDYTPRDWGKWGYDTSATDKSVKPGNDFDEYANGAWKARTEIPNDQSSTGSGWAVVKLNEHNLRQIVTGASPDSQLGALYHSFMDTDRINALGIAPLKPRIDALYGISDKADFTKFMGSTKADFGSSIFDWGIIPDPADPSINILYMSQAGLALPNRDYYIDPKYAKEKAAYRDYLERTFTEIGYPDPAKTAQSVLEFETAIAEASWPAADSRSIEKINNPMTLSELQAYAPGLDWAALLGASGITGNTKIIVAENTAIKAIAKFYGETPLPLLKAWETARVVASASPFLSDEYVDSQFKLTSALSGAKQLRPRWTRALRLIDGSLGELLGQIYVEKYFPPSSKAAMESLVANLKTAMKARIEGNSWMAPATKQEALVKLAKMDVMVGYPDKFRDYSKLVLKPDDLIGNVQRVSANEWDYERAKLGKPVDRSLWGMTPQTVNAYNGGLENKIVFPAGILQPPFFNPKADAAVNYGAIGAVIGHEISHGFDDQGRKIDDTGAIRDWWTKGDAERFDAKTKEFGAEYAKFEPVPGHTINPDLTMGENIADMAGLRVALDAYHLSLKGKPAPVIDGLTGDQRFFLAFAQAWQNKSRPEQMTAQMASDPHSPARFRILGPLPNIDAWYQAFGVKPGDTMYLPPEKRVQIW